MSAKLALKTNLHNPYSGQQTVIRRTFCKVKFIYIQLSRLCGNRYFCKKCFISYRKSLRNKTHVFCFLSFHARKPILNSKKGRIYVDVCILVARSNWISNILFFYYATRSQLQKLFLLLHKIFSNFEDHTRHILYHAS